MSSRHLAEKGFKSIKRDWENSGKIAMIYLIMWLRRVSSLSLDLSIKLGMLKIPTLAALFLKRSDELIKC